MASFEFACPACGQTLEGSDEWVGQSVPCPECNHTFIVPAPPAAPPGPAAGKACPHCRKPMPADAVLCIECGYHTGLGKVIKTDLG